MKLKELQRHLKRKGIALALLVHPDVNITYFTQIKPSFAIFIVSPSRATLYLTSLDEKPHLRGIAVKTLKKGWEKKLASSRIRTLGINKEVVSVAFWEKIHKLFPRARLVDLSGELKQLRAQKTEEEVRRISQASRITDRAFSTLLGKLNRHRVKTEKEVALLLERAMQEQGATPAFPTIAAMGKNAAIPHYQTSGRKLRRGFLLLDFGASYKNYHSDMSRTVFLGVPNRLERQLYHLLLRTQLNTLEQITEERLFFELQQYAKKQLGKYASHFTHLLGHGIGLEVHESPSFSLEAKDRVQRGQVFTQEPGIYFPRKMGIRIEDTVLFDGKAKLLTKSPKELISIKGY